MSARKVFESILAGTMIAAFAAGCGGADPNDRVSTLTAQTFRGEDPGCGSNCPSTCWVEIDTAGPGKDTYLWIFDADRHDEEVLRDGKYSLSITGDAFLRELDEVLPETIPSTFYTHWTLPETFNIYGSNLTAEVLLSPGESDMLCEIAPF